MDTISRENNSSMLPVGGIIVGVIALLLGGFAAIKVSGLQKSVEGLQPKVDKIDSIEASVASAATNSDKAAKDIKTLRDTTQDAFNTLVPTLQGLQTSVTRLEEAAKKPVASATKSGKSGAAPVAADEYVVKAGDISGAKIARDHGVSLSDLQAVNPGVNWNKLGVGQKIKLPKK